VLGRTQLRIPVLRQAPDVTCYFKSEPMLPKELEDIFEEYAEDDYNLYVTKADNSGDDFIIEFVLNVQNINDKGAITQRWKILTSSQIKNHVSFDSADFLKIKDDHPLLWEFTDTQCQLYFTGQCKDPAKLFYDLYTAHKRTFGNYQCFNISFGEEAIYFKPFQYSNGLLTEGSKKLLTLYAECLKQNSLDFTIIGERIANYWNGEQYTSDSQSLKVLFLGDTFIIAKDFSFVLRDQNSR